MIAPPYAALGRVGGLTTIARHGPDAITARAREGLRRRFEREADPLGELPEHERRRRADAASTAPLASRVEA